MNHKHILIVDDEESILTILKNSLTKLNYQVTTVSDGFAALDQIARQSFDLVVTDFNMAQMDGLELLEAIRYAQPEAQVILITAYGSHGLKDEVDRLKAKFLSKPLEIDSFRQVVQETLGDITPNQAEILILSNKRHNEVKDLLTQLGKDIRARCIFLTDVQGQIIARLGNTDKIHIQETASLLGGSIATLREAGRAIDGDQNDINLAYREGMRECLYALNVGRRMILILIIDRGQYSSRLGTVWYYAQRVAVNLRQILREVEFVNPQQIFDTEIDQAFDLELDKLFVDNSSI